MLGIIKREIASGEDNLAGCLLARRRLATQKGTDTRQQLFHSKRFRDKIIGSKVKQAHAFIFVTLIIEHDNGGLEKFAQALEQFEAAYVLQTR